MPETLKSKKSAFPSSALSAQVQRVIRGPTRKSQHDSMHHNSIMDRSPNRRNLDCALEPVKGR